MRFGYSYDVVGYEFTGKERDSESGLDMFGGGWPTRQLPARSRRARKDGNVEKCSPSTSL